MPIIKSAQKAQRQTKKRTLLNKSKKEALSAMILRSKKNKKDASLPTLYSTVDKMVKKGVLHKNKAKRIKSRLAKLIVSKPPSPSPSLKKKPNPKSS